MRITILTLVLTLALPAVAEQKKSICMILDKAVSSGTAKHKLTRYLDEIWKHEMEEDPEFATYAGYPGQNDRWTDMSIEALDRADKEEECQLKALKKIPRSGLKGEDQVTFDLALYSIERSIEANKFGGRYLVLDHMGGLHMDIVDTLAGMPKANKADYENMISRLSKVPELEEQIEALLKEGLKRKITPVKMFLERTPAQFDLVLTSKVEDSPLYEPFKDIGGTVKDSEKAGLQKKALEVIQTKTYPALQRLRAFVVKEYIPGARESISQESMPNGKLWYEYMIQKHTTTKKTAEELHQLGLNEVARITAEMKKIKDQVQFKGDLKAFNKYLLTEDRFYFKNKDDLLNAYRAIGKRVDPELPRLFKTLPRLPYGIREVPEYKAKETPTAYYEGGSLEAGRAGYFVANTYDLKARPKWGMEALTLHEAVPGHHLQIALAQEIQGLPNFRKYSGYTAYTEGWGLYGEYLGTELGMYKDPYSKYGQLTYEIWRAVRLVVDTGIHHKGWSRKQAIEYFTGAMPKSQLEAEVEVDRYITRPGQALAYKVGELKFRELREKAQARLGDKFDVREFHDELLKHGSLPLDILEKIVNEWLSKKAS